MVDKNDRVHRMRCKARLSIGPRPLPFLWLNNLIAFNDCWSWPTWLRVMMTPTRILKINSFDLMGQETYWSWAPPKQTLWKLTYTYNSKTCCKVFKFSPFTILESTIKTRESENPLAIRASYFLFTSISLFTSTSCIVK